MDDDQRQLVGRLTLRARLAETIADIGDEREGYVELVEQKNHALEECLREALEAEMSVTEFARLAKISRQTVHSMKRRIEADQG